MWVTQAQKAQIIVDVIVENPSALMTVSASILSVINVDDASSSVQASPTVVVALTTLFLISAGFLLPLTLMFPLLVGCSSSVGH